MNKYVFLNEYYERVGDNWISKAYIKEIFIVYNFFYVENEIDSSSNWYNYVGECHKDSFFCCYSSVNYPQYQSTVR